MGITGCRLLFLTPQLGVGGLERQLFALLKALDRDCHRPCVAVWNFDDAERYVAEVQALGVPVVALVGSSPWAKLRALRQLVGRLRPDVVHSCSFYANVAVAYACWLRPCVAVGSLRGDFTHDQAKSGPLLGRLSARFPPRQIANSWRAVENVGRASGPFVPRDLRVVPNGIDLAEFSPAPRAGARPVVVAGIGTLSQLKNWAALLPLAAGWAADGLEVRVRIAGDGPERSALAAEIHRLGIGACFELAGVVDDVPRFLADADLLVHVSTREGMPNAVLEAMAAGRPVVAFDSGDVSRLVDDGVSGYVVPLGAADQLDARLRALFADDSRREEMGRAARDAAGEFSSEGLAARMLEAYSSFGAPVVSAAP